MNHPQLFPPENILWSATLGYDWKWAGHLLGMMAAIQNVFDREFFPAD